MTYKSFEHDLKNKVVVITGAGGVICGELALAFAHSGAKLALINRSFESAEAVAEKIRSAGGTAQTYVANVLDRAALVSVKARINEELGAVDILINGAGGNNARATTDTEFLEKADAEGLSFFDLSEEGIRECLDLNFLGTFLPSQVFMPDMLGRKGCCVLNISSMNAIQPFTKIVSYSAAKAAVSNYTAWLAAHFARTGIRVNELAPGVFLTRQNQSLLYDKDGNPTPRTAKILAKTPMGRLGQVEELAGAALFLCCESLAGFITGASLAVDGGFGSFSGV